MSSTSLHSRARPDGAPPRVVIIGGGPAGLMAAEQCAGAAVEVHVYDSMPSFGRKFLLAGKSGLNLTHSEEEAHFLTRFGDAAPHLAPALAGFTPAMLRDWAGALGSDTFIGSSGRVFLRSWKASPLLRAWLQRLAAQNVRFHPRHRWLGWAEDGRLQFETPHGVRHVEADATILALGGASWPRLGSDGSWVALLKSRGVAITPLRPANCGFDIDWSPHVATRFAGAPVKPVTLHFRGEALRGEFVVTRHGVEGSAIYALSARLRDAIEQDGKANLMLDLAPDRSLERLTADLEKPRGKHSRASHLRKTTGIEGVKAALLREQQDLTGLAPAALAKAIKATPLTLTAARPLEEAISTAGGIALNELDADFKLTRLPGVYAVGEMLDWEAPTGGYLLTACLATGRAAGRAVLSCLTKNSGLS
ncbi:MAG: TIGR03862 family flavoprotein [Rhizobiales bacterium]|nr:TIGR03862 family flavoprotein [Hyphomicrobiales bacterium]